jgi:preprotein translocase subunit SecE
MLRVGVYKRSQGRVTRQVTFAALAATIAIGCWRLGEQFKGYNPGSHFGLSAGAVQVLLQFGLPFVLLLVGVWICYRVVNVPSFADFLIAVEAEMNKVSWPGRTELVRASLVVLVVILVIVLALMAIDFFWQFVLQGILHFFSGPSS